MRAGAGILICCAAGAIAGCGTTASDQVKAKISQFVKAGDAPRLAGIVAGLAPDVEPGQVAAALSLRSSPNATMSWRPSERRM